MISRTGLQAIHSLVYLARLTDDSFAGAGKIAAAIDAAPNYLSKLLHLLGRRGLVDSQKGRGGGFRLAREASSISLKEVVESIESTERWHRCVLGQRECSEENPCIAHDQWSVVRDGFLQLLARTSIADLADSRGSGAA